VVVGLLLMRQVVKVLRLHTAEVVVVVRAAKAALVLYELPTSRIKQKWQVIHHTKKSVEIP
jgi:hypothetical protein